MTQASKKELVRVFARRYGRPKAAEKGSLLDQFCELTG